MERERIMHVLCMCAVHVCCACVLCMCAVHVYNPFFTRALRQVQYTCTKNYHSSTSRKVPLSWHSTVRFRREKKILIVDDTRNRRYQETSDVLRNEWRFARKKIHIHIHIQIKVQNTKYKILFLTRALGGTQIHTHSTGTDTRAQVQIQIHTHRYRYRYTRTGTDTDTQKSGPFQPIVSASCFQS
jgi:hypothetical protein